MKTLVMLIVLVSASSCGTLRINPRSCKTYAVWGNSPDFNWGVSRDELENEKVIDLKMKETFIVFYNRDLKLRELLEDHGIKCEDVKKVRVKIKTSLFFMREISLKVVKN